LYFAFRFPPVIALNIYNLPIRTTILTNVNFLHGQITAGAKKSEKQKELTESALGLKLGLIGFVSRISYLVLRIALGDWV